MRIRTYGTYVRTYVRELRRAVAVAVAVALVLSPLACQLTTGTVRSSRLINRLVSYSGLLMLALACPGGTEYLEVNGTCRHFLSGYV